MDLFAHGRKSQIQAESPLANRMRPRTLEEFAGQEHIVGPGRLLRRAIQADQLSSLIFYGPPGTGKTTLAMVIANSTQSHFITINAVLAGVAQIREAIGEAQERRKLYGQRTTLFVDEVHRWNKAQQDALLPHVENGTIILIGATTENPYFEVNKALVSRSRIFQLKPLTQADLNQIANRALEDTERGYGSLDITVHENALDHLVDVSNGDARGVLNALELAVETTTPDSEGRVVIDLAVAEESIQQRAVLYDKEGDAHFDTISAFIKSLRGSDPDAALYWMAKMVYAGEDPRFIFRRMAILASEDVGLADPQAAVVVAACWDLYERVGMPEGRFHLAQAALYLSTCKKSNTTLSFFDALAAVEKEREPEVPVHLRDGNRDSEGFGHGKGYLYPHAYRDHWVEQQYLPQALQGKVFYEPGDQGYEQQIGVEVARRREAQLAAMVGEEGTLPEVLTTGPQRPGQEVWLQRTIADSGRQLGHQRDNLFELVQVQRHHLVLDLKAGSGLLTWEAVRVAPEGGVWAMTENQTAGEALKQQAARLPELERPVILIGRLEELPYLLHLRGEDELQFDRIIGRSAFNRLLDAGEVIGDLVGRLAAGGRLGLIQMVPYYAQRLYRLVDLSGLPERLARSLSEAEEAIYDDASNLLVNWHVDDLRNVLGQAGLKGLTIKENWVTEERRISEEQLDRWFCESPENDNGQPSYLQHLGQAEISDDQLYEIETLYRQQLTGSVVQWRSKVLYVVGEN
jgi:putative ATPase